MVSSIVIVSIDQTHFNISLERAKLLSTIVKTSNMFFKRIFVQKLVLTVRVIISTKDITLVLHMWTVCGVDLSILHNEGH